MAVTPASWLGSRGQRGRELFLRLLDRHVDTRVVVAWEDGATEVGPPAIAGQAPLGIRILRPPALDRVLTYGNLGLAEAFMDGDLTFEGELTDLLTVLLRARLDEKLASDPRLLAAVALLAARHRLAGTGPNVRHHYDTGDDLFASFLDSSMTYSCGYARSADDDLEALQQQKLDRICDKLQLAEGQTLLDIGCGWGGLLVHAARRHGVRGVGVTTSRNQAEGARRRIAAAGLSDRITVKLEDFRKLNGTFDRVVSVGMMEHVPRRLYPAYFRTLASTLAPGGRGLLHAIGCGGASNDHDPFIQKYIFPGSGQVRLSEIASGMEKNGLWMLDVENMIRHYGLTIERWRDRFRQNAAGLDPVKYDARFRRMWEYYLCAGIAAARASDSALYQVLFTNDRAGERPLRRV